MWYETVYNFEEIKNEGCAYLDSKLNITEEEIRDGIAYLTEYMLENENLDIYPIDENYDKWENMSEEDKEEDRELADEFLTIFNDSLSLFCCKSIAAAYIANGKIGEIDTYLATAVDCLNKLEEDDPDYQYYSESRGYYGSVNAFLEYCTNPTGSFSQSQDTFNEYKNEARNYMSQLDYVFEE